MAIDPRVNLPTDLDDVLEDFGNVVVQGITSAIVIEAEDFEDIANDLIKQIESELKDRTDEIINASDEAAARALSKLDDLIDTVGDESKALERFITGGLENVSEESEDLFSTLTRKVFDFGKDRVDDVFEFTDSIGEKIQTEVIDRAKEGVEALNTLRVKIQDGITDAADDIVDGIGGVLQKVGDAVSNLSEVFEPLLENLPSSIWSSFASAFAPVLAPLGALVRFFSKDAIESSMRDFEPIFDQVESDPDVRDIIDPKKKFGFPPLIIGAFGVIVGAVIVVPIQATMLFFAGKMEKIKQRGLVRERPTLLSPAEMRELLNRGELPPEKAVETHEKMGFTDEDIERSIGLSRQLLGLGEILALWRRKEITEDEANARIQNLGFPDQDTNLLKVLGFQIPPIQDIILFAVREVFDPEQADRLGQLEGLSSTVLQAYRDKLSGFGEGIEGATQAVTEFARQSGLAPEWTAAYWASHWRQPGVNSLFDMVHRLAPDIVEDRRADFEGFGLDPDSLPFTLEDLQRTLRAQDFSGFWRDRLTAIAFSPITRVDVRRLHKLGLITDIEVIRRYRELGFSPSDADLMGQFTFAFNATPEVVDDVETKALTRAQVLDFFESGAMAEDDAREALITIGYTPDVAETFIALTLIDQAKKQQGLVVRATMTRFNAGLIDFNEVVQQLDAINLPPLQRDSTIAQAEAELASRIREPSRAELDRFGREEIIDRAEYEENLSRLGYSALWSKRFGVLIYDGERDLTRAQILQFMEDEEFTEEQTIDELVKVGFSDADAIRFIRQRQQEIADDATREAERLAEQSDNSEG